MYKRSEIGNRIYKKLEDYVKKISPIRDSEGFWKCCGEYSNSGNTGGIPESTRFMSHISRRIIFRGDRQHLDLVIEIFGLKDGIFVLKLILKGCINAQQVIEEYIKRLETEQITTKKQNFKKEERLI